MIVLVSVSGRFSGSGKEKMRSSSVVLCILGYLENSKVFRRSRHRELFNQLVQLVDDLCFFLKRLDLKSTKKTDHYKRMRAYGNRTIEFQEEKFGFERV